MANEVLVAGTADLRTTEIMSSEFLMLLADRGDLFQHPALVYAGAAQGSNKVRVPQLGLGGYDLLAAGTDGTALANTALTDGSSDITVAWYGKTYAVSDLAQVVAANGLIDPVMFAQDAAISVAQTLISLLAGLMGGFSNTVGSTGVDLSAANFVDAITQLEVSKVSGPLMAILHPQQYGDLRSASLSLGGAVQYREDAQALVMSRSNSSQYKGNIFGVDVFCSSHVPVSAGDRAGGMFGRGAVAWADAQFPANGDPNIISLGRAAFERDRSGTAGLTNYTTHAFMGVIECIDAAGVGIITDA